MSAIGELAQLRLRDGKRSRKLSRRAKSEERAGYAFMTPWILGIIVITAGPMLASLYLSFTDYSFLSSPEWVGLANYRELLVDARFHQAIKVTFEYVVISVPLQLIIALLVAMLLDGGLRGMGLYRSAYYLPSLIGGSVAIAILWRQVFGAEGLFNQFLATFGIEGLSWIAHPDTALGTLIVLNVWTFGAPMIIFLAGLRQIPTMYYEAAAVDGAGRLRRFWNITIPMLTPIIFFNLILQLIGAFQAFTQAFIISGGSGAPSDSTLFYTLYLYLEGFGNFQMGYASAMAWVLVVIIGGFTALNFVLSKYWVFYDD